MSIPSSIVYLKRLPAIELLEEKERMLADRAAHGQELDHYFSVVIREYLVDLRASTEDFIPLDPVATCLLEVE